MNQSKGGERQPSQESPPEQAGRSGCFPSSSSPAAAAAAATTRPSGRASPREQAKYFWRYAHLKQQKQTLEDVELLEAYHCAISENALHFEDKVVLDVGCGIGVLALFAAQAGARKVYAVEATDSAKFAKRLVTHNRMENVVTVIQGTIEQVELPEKADIIVSEFMGRFLLSGSMLDSVLYARDKYLKIGGAIYPSSARMYLALSSHIDVESQAEDLSQDMESWEDFLAKATYSYDVNFSCLTQVFEEEAKGYYLSTNLCVDLEPSDLLGPPVCIKNIDLLTATLNDVKSVRQSFTLDISPGKSSGSAGLSLTSFVGWFSVHFDGSPFNPSLVEVSCSSEPKRDFASSPHRDQEAFIVNPPLALQAGDKVECHLQMSRMEYNWRLYDVNIDYSVCSASGQKGAQHSCQYHLSHD